MKGSGLITVAAALVFSLTISSLVMAQGGGSSLPDAAVAPVGAIGEISDTERGILGNTLLAGLSRSYRLVSQDEYSQAEERAFQELEDEQCTAEQCIRKIQEILQVERLYVLQVIREGDFTQLTLTLTRLEDKIVRADTCQGCSIAQLNAKVAGLAAAATAADLGGTLVIATPAPALGGNGQVFVTSNPTGGEVLLDGKRIPKMVTEALLEEVPAGEHRITVNKGNLTATQLIKVEPDQIARLELELKPANVQLQVNSKPFKATVTVDGRAMGETPLIASLTAGTHRVRIELKGYVPYEKKVEVKRGVKNRIQTTLVKGGTLSISGYQSTMTVKVDGDIVTPRENGRILLKPGTRQISVSRRGYKTIKVKAKIAIGKVTKFDARLEPLSGTLTLTSNFAGARIVLTGGEYVNQKISAALPMKKRKLPIGNYRVEIDDPDIEPLTLRVKVEEGKETVKRIALTDLRPLREAQAHDEQLGKWKTKLGWAIGLGALAGLYAYSEDQAVQDSNDKQAALANELDPGLTTSQYNEKYDDLQQEEESAATHQQNVYTAALLSGIALGVATWLWLDPPPEPSTAMILPLPDQSGAGLQLALQLRW